MLNVTINILLIIALGEANELVRSSVHDYLINVHLTRHFHPESSDDQFNTFSSVRGVVSKLSSTVLSL